MAVHESDVKHLKHMVQMTRWNSPQMAALKNAIAHIEAQPKTADGWHVNAEDRVLGRGWKHDCEAWRVGHSISNVYYERANAEAAANGK